MSTNSSAGLRDLTSAWDSWACEFNNLYGWMDLPATATKLDAVFRRERRRPALHQPACELGCMCAWLGPFCMGASGLHVGAEDSGPLGLLRVRNCMLQASSRCAKREFIRPVTKTTACCTYKGTASQMHFETEATSCTRRLRVTAYVMLMPFCML